MEQNIPSLVGPLEDLMYENPYDKAYSAGYNGDKEPKNPFKKDTLAYWFFTNLYTQGSNEMKKHYLKLKCHLTI